MVLVINAKGQYWDGLAWNQKGKEFLSVPSAIRSLHEEGEDPEEANFVEVKNDSP
jgi:hypothetical protein